MTRSHGYSEFQGTVGLYWPSTFYSGRQQRGQWWTAALGEPGSRVHRNKAGQDSEQKQLCPIVPGSHSHLNSASAWGAESQWEQGKDRCAWSIEFIRQGRVGEGWDEGQGMAGSGRMGIVERTLKS